MKLDKLWIEDFKNLKDFSIDFDETSSVTVLIGWNGSGKSNLFEALSIIFRDLDLEKITPFAYKLEYLCYGNRVKVDNDPKRSVKERVKKEITPLQSNKFSKLNSEYLPSHVFGYYSGPSNRLKEYFLDHQRRYYDVVVHTEKYTPTMVSQYKSIRRMFCAEPVHSKFALLAFFYKEDDQIASFLKDYFNIVGLESVLFVMKKPTWAKTNKHLWGAGGLVRDFLDRLYNVSLAPMKLRQRVSTTVKRSKTEELYYLFVKDLNSLIELAKAYLSQTDFFASLESTYLSEVIHDVIIRVKIKNNDGTLGFKELSEGEQQLLMVLGLLRFTKEKESLILLDEPDTHLNPGWGLMYLKLLNEIVGGQEESHIIMATHDPIVISGLTKKQVQIMKRAENLSAIAGTPTSDPIGMGYTGILTSEMFNFRSDLDQLTLSYLDRKVELGGKERLSSAEIKELTKINEHLDKSGFLETYSDPYFAAFVKAWAKKNKSRRFMEPFLADNDRKDMATLADEIVGELEGKK